MNKPIIWYVDEDLAQSKTYSNELRLLLPSSLDVKTIYPPHFLKQDYLEVLQHPDTACLILDQKLKDAGTATYSGIELATYLRSINPKIPIYILTNYARDDEEKEEFSDSGWTVEQIIDKGHLRNSTYAQEIAARITRHTNVYEDILSHREKKFRTLLKKSVNGELSEQEQNELKELQFERLQVMPETDLVEQQKLNELIKVNTELLNLLKIHTKE